MAICKTDNCESEATYGFRYATPEYCRLHGREKGAKTQFGVCMCGYSIPRFALPGDKVSCCCKCKKQGMLDLIKKRCICGKVPLFGNPKDKSPSCCASCRTSNMINIKTKMCTCGKVPSFGNPTDKNPTCCSKCRLVTMINLVGGKCKCKKKAAKYGLPNSKVAEYCNLCKSQGMIILKAKKCNCGLSQPSFGLSTDKKATCCAKCKLSSMINLKQTKCNCGRAAPCFGLKGDKNPTCCVKCKVQTMINLNKVFCKCGSAQAYFGFKTDNKGSCCSSCRVEGMIDIVSPKCPGLINYEGKGKLDCPYNHRQNKTYDNFCTKCFEQNFPEDPRTALICKNSKELEVKRFLSKNFTQFIHDTTLWTGQRDCTCRRRIDFRWLIGNTLLCVEVDERQHKSRDQNDEDLRYDDLMMLHGGKFIFIRYNPDIYIDKNGKRKNPEIATRLASLKSSILHSIQRIQEEKNTELLEIQSLFFDEI